MAGQDGANESVEQKAAVEAEGVQASTPEGEAAPDAQPTSEAPSISIQGLPDGMTLQDYVQSEVAKVERKYEGPDGDIARLKSANAKRMREMSQQIQARTQEDLRAAEQVAEREPRRAYEMAAQTAQTLYTQQQIDQAQGVWADYVEGQLVAAGHDPTSPEVGKRAVEQTERLLSLALAQRGEHIQEQRRFELSLKDEALAEERDGRQQAEKENQQLKESIPELVQAEVTKALVGAGYAPEGTAGDAPSAPTGTDESWRKKPADQLKREGMAELRAEMEKMAKAS